MGELFISFYSYVKRGKLLVIIIFSSLTYVNGQETVLEEYWNNMGDFAIIYGGELESVYSLSIYNLLPYFETPEYVSGYIVYNGIMYPNQKLRLDIYKDQLIVLTPNTQLAKIVNCERIEQFTLNDKVFIRYTDLENQADKKFKPGFYQLAYNGGALKLLHKENYLLKRQSDQKRYVFKHESNYYLVNDGVSHVVKNKKSFISVFPEFKKEINQYVKENSLDFRSEKQKSLSKLVKYCDELINQQ